ncbi:MAG: hypothetical protein ABID40_04870 [Candidatus Bipolaricaulota bacterium]
MFRKNPPILTKFDREGRIISAELNPVKDFEVEYDLVAVNGPIVIPGAATGQLVFNTLENDPVLEVYAIMSTEFAPAPSAAVPTNYLVDIDAHYLNMHLMNTPLHHDLVCGGLAFDVAGNLIGQFPGYFGSSMWIPPGAGLVVNITNLDPIAANTISVNMVLKARGYIAQKSAGSVIERLEKKIRTKASVPFWLSPGAPVVIAAALGAAPAVDFWCTVGSSFVAKAFVAQTFPVNRAFTVRFRGGSNSTNQWWSNAVVPSALCQGTARAPCYLWAEPLIPEDGHVYADFVDASGALNTTIYPALVGYKLFDKGAPWADFADRLMSVVEASRG